MRKIGRQRDRKEMRDWDRGEKKKKKTIGRKWNSEELREGKERKEGKKKLLREGKERKERKKKIEQIKQGKERWRQDRERKKKKLNDV